ncbi:hypothetical protein HMPREF1326_01299, partial [Akkermansia sp. KLE1605]
MRPSTQRKRQGIKDNAPSRPLRRKIERFYSVFEQPCTGKTLS